MLEVCWVDCLRECADEPGPKLCAQDHHRFSSNHFVAWGGVIDCTREIFGIITAATLLHACLFAFDWLALCTSSFLCWPFSLGQMPINTAM